MMDGPYTIECIGGPEDGRVLVVSKLPKTVETHSVRAVKAGPLGAVKAVPVRGTYRPGKHLMLNGHIAFCHTDIKVFRVRGFNA